MAVRAGVLNYKHATTKTWAETTALAPKVHWQRKNAGELVEKM